MTTETIGTSPEHHLQIRQWLSSFVTLFTVTSANVHVGVVVFNSDVVVAIDLLQYSNANDVSQAIMRIPYTAGLTNTAAFVTL